MSGPAPVEPMSKFAQFAWTVLALGGLIACGIAAGGLVGAFAGFCYAVAHLFSLALILRNNIQNDERDPFD